VRTALRATLCVLLGFTAGLVLRAHLYPGQEFDHLFATVTEQAGGEGQWLHRSELLDAEFREIVKPNVDTLYSTAALDLRGRDYVLHAPASERYWSVQFSQRTTDVFGYVGSRTHGYGRSVTALITRSEDVPPEVRRRYDAILRAPSDRVWLLARYVLDGPDDLPRVRNLQAQLRLEERAL